MQLLANPTPAYEIIWQPQPGPQTDLLRCPVFEVFYGGARGGGKTESSIGDWLQHSAMYGADAVGVFFRRNVTQLSEVIERTKVLFKKLGADWHEQKKMWTMPGGGRLMFRYLERDSDAEQYQGHSYTRLYIEELTNFPSSGPIDKLRATLRSPVGVPCGMRLTGNPGGPGHNWVKARYINPAPMGYRIITESTDIEIDGVMMNVSLDRVFIPSRLKDNMLLLRNDPTYVLRLKQAGSEQLVKAWLDGNWDVIDGAFFSEWDPGLHILPTDVIDCIPRHATRFRSFDWGSARPFSVGWYAVSDGLWKMPLGLIIPPAGALVKYREWYGMEPGKPNVGLKMTVQAVAKGILAREMAAKDRISYGVADPAIFIRDGGPSKAESMLIEGVSWRRADNKRDAGAEQMHLRLKGAPLDEATYGPPLLYFLDCCEDSIRTIPVLQHDPDKLEDIDTDAEDHAYDETRYGVMSRPRIARVQTVPGTGLPKLPGQMTINELMELQRRKRLAAQE